MGFGDQGPGGRPGGSYNRPMGAIERYAEVPLPPQEV